MNRSVSYFTTELSAATVVLPEKKGSGLDQELRHEFVRRNKVGYHRGKQTRSGNFFYDGVQPDQTGCLTAWILMLPEHTFPVKNKAKSCVTLNEKLHLHPRLTHRVILRGEVPEW